MHYFLEQIPRLAPYLLMLLIYGTLSIVGRLINSKLLHVIAVVFLVAFVGFSATMSPDWERYRDTYESALDATFSSIEPSFIIISLILGYLNLSYHFLFTLYAAITFYFIYKGAVNFTGAAYLPILLYLLIPGFFLNLFVELRQGASVAIAFYATSLLFKYGLKNKKYTIAIYAILSILFHYSALIYWLVFLFARKVTDKVHARTTYILTVIASMIIPTSFLIAIIYKTIYPFLMQKYQAYIDLFMYANGSMAESGQLLKDSVYLIMTILFVFCNYSHKEEHRKIFRPLNLFIYGVVLLNLLSAMSDMSRIAYYFLIYQVVIWPMVIDSIDNKVGRWLSTCAVSAVYLIQFIYGAYFLSEETGTHIFLHYKLFFL